MLLVTLMTFFVLNLNANSLPVELRSDTTICQGDSILLSVEISADSIQYLWSTGDTTQSIFVFDPAIYSVTVTSPSCFGQDSIVLMTKPSPTVSLLVEESCFGDSTMFINNSIYSDSASVLWDFGDGTTLDSVTGFWSHLYSVNGGVFPVSILIDNNNGCSSLDTFFVNSKLQPTADFLVDTVCLNSNTSIINQSQNVEINGVVSIDYGDGNNVQLNNEMTYEYLYDDSQFFQLLFVVDNLNGCTDSVSLSTLVHPLPQVSFSGLENTYCPQIEPDTLYGIPSGGVFNGPNIVDNNSMDSLGFVIPMEAGQNVSITYSYIDINGCENNDEQIVEEFFPGVDIEFLIDDSNYCIDEPNDTVSLNIFGGVLSGESIMVFPNEIFFVFTPTQVGSFPITYSVTDDDMCLNSETQLFEVSSLPDFTLGNDTFLTPGEVLVLDVGENENFEYLWSNGSTDHFIEVKNPGFYILNVVDNQTGCFGADTIRIDFGTTIFEIKKKNNVKIFPNPATTFFQFLIKEHLIDALENLIIFDVNGRSIECDFRVHAVDKELNKITVNIEKLPSGIYFMAFENSMYKFVKI